MNACGQSSVSAVPHVLIVEDNADTRTVLRIFLEMEGMTVTEAGDGLEALDRLRHLRHQNSQAPSIILLDWMMPRCSGDAFRRMQLANAATAGVPVVVISAAAESEEAFRTLEPSAVVKKPFQLEHLLTVIKEALRPSS